ncbi:translation initiation factor IF-2, partial [Desertibaculum subflavum]|uniref:translation initiation factor IF-2 n=1 Tax=Desertibaculum subflavum TaxID=2268458 RepID=UPI000E668F54
RPARAEPAPSRGPAGGAPRSGQQADRSLRGRVVLRQLTDEEKAARARALEGSIRADAEARKRAEEDAKRRAADEVRLGAEREAAAKRAAEEEARKRQEDEARRRGEQEAARRLHEPEAAAPATDAAGAAARGRPAGAAEEEEEARKRLRPGMKAPIPVKAPATRGRGGEQRRGGGRLTVTTALDESERVRSLAAYRRQQQRERRQQMGMSREAPKKVLRDVILPESITVQELASRMAERSVDVIKSLMKMGMMVTITQAIDADTAELVIQEFGHRARRVSESDIELGLVGEVDQDEHLLSRPPVVTIMGHVDHGKTSLLDALRETDVAAGEAGGITQHIGAYQVNLKSGARITFLDTPGHEAFTAMRARGAKVTDIVVLVVAADDSVMPQTIEAIRHAKAANVPIVVAINKVDKPDARPQRVREQLLQHEIVVEEMGGEVLAIEVSAKTKQGLDKLEEAILLQAEILDLKANPDRAAEGAVVEAQLDRGRGPVATVLVQRGTLRVGDIFVAGSEWGRVRALVDDRGKNIEEAGPAMPVEVLGLQGLPEAGDSFSVVENEARAREISDYRQRKARDTKAVVGGRGTVEQMFAKIKAGELKELPIVVKADVQGSLEAIVSATAKFATEEVAARVLHAAVGGINESDVTLARASEGMIIGFNVRANKQARDLATRDHVDIRYYSVIYEVLDDLKAMLSGMLAPSLREQFLGNAEIRQVFNITKVGKVAGCMITEGTVKRGAKVRLLRDNVVIHEGTLSTLKRFKDEVREVKQGTECGMSFENYDDIREGDIIECFEVIEVARQL